MRSYFSFNPVLLVVAEDYFFYEIIVVEGVVLL